MSIALSLNERISILRNLLNDLLGSEAGLTDKNIKVYDDSYSYKYGDHEITVFKRSDGIWLGIAKDFDIVMLWSDQNEEISNLLDQIYALMPPVSEDEKAKGKAAFLQGLL